jgi:GntR family transcriptional regulator/MocR family aminotransferase
MLIAALAEELPDAVVDGISAGLHATVRLPAGSDEEALRREILKQGIALEFLSDHCLGAKPEAPTLLLGYGRTSESAIRAGMRRLASAVRAARDHQAR